MVGSLNLDPVDYEFYGIFYKGKCKDVVRWSPSIAKKLGRTRCPQLEDFIWRNVFDSKGDFKKNWYISKLEITEVESPTDF